jgi:hypothetical protein
MAQRFNPIGDRERLTNVHFGLENPDGKSYCVCMMTQEGAIELVEGSYAYYHYMQDNFNDNGWGCAYRSLQVVLYINDDVTNEKTIQSWFIHQNFCSQPVLNHREIQKIIFEEGQRNISFIGSKEWIGSLGTHFILFLLTPRRNSTCSTCIQQNLIQNIALAQRI